MEIINKYWGSQMRKVKELDLPEMLEYSIQKLELSQNEFADLVLCWQWLFSQAFVHALMKATFPIVSRDFP